MVTATVLTFREITVGELLEQGNSLFREHWEEIALNKDVMVLEPDKDRYFALERDGFLFIIGCFSDDRLVGYSVNVVAPHMHYASLVYCSNDLLFVTKEHRGVGRALMSATESAADARGAVMMQWHAKFGSTLDKILAHNDDYIVQDIIHTRVF